MPLNRPKFMFQYFISSVFEQQIIKPLPEVKTHRTRETIASGEKFDMESKALALT